MSSEKKQSLMTLVTLVIGLLTIGSMLLLAGIYIAPLSSLPEDTKELHDDIAKVEDRLEESSKTQADIAKAQAVQAKSMEHLTQATSQIAGIMRAQSILQTQVTLNGEKIEGHDELLRAHAEHLRKMQENLKPQ